MLLGFLSQDAIGARPALARISTALVAFVLAGMLPLHGQDQPPGVDAAGPIATDRPAVTNSSVVVPAGSLQAENGFLDTSVEYAGDFPEVGGPRHLLHFGTALKITKQQQIDFHVGVGLSSAAVDHLVSSAIRSAFRRSVARCSG